MSSDHKASNIHRKLFQNLLLVQCMQTVALAAIKHLYKVVLLKCTHLIKEADFTGGARKRALEIFK